MHSNALNFIRHRHRLTKNVLQIFLWNFKWFCTSKLTLNYDHLGIFPSRKKIISTAFFFALNYNIFIKMWRKVKISSTFERFGVGVVVVNGAIGCFEPIRHRKSTPPPATNRQRKKYYKINFIHQIYEANRHSHFLAAKESERNDGKRQQQITTTATTTITTILSTRSYVLADLCVCASARACFRCFHRESVRCLFDGYREFVWKFISTLILFVRWKAATSLECVIEKSRAFHFVQ